MRQRGTTGVTLLPATLLALYVSSNLILAAIGIPDRIALAKRCGEMSIISLLPLFLGGRTSFLVDSLLSLRLDQYELAHRWIGRMCIVLGVIHSSIHAANMTKGLQTKNALASHRVEMLRIC